MSHQTVVKFKDSIKTDKKRERIPCLTVVEGNHIGEVFRISKSSVIVGRSEVAEIVLSEEGVSRDHARIDKHEETYMLSDLESTNGTFVNGEQIEQVVLRDGDKIQMGEVLLRFAFQDSIDVNYQETLRNMAMRDGLTKVFNRRFFLETLEREVNYALRQRQPLCLIMLDIDHFKKANDTYGHQAGDVVLRELAAALSNEVRGYDVFARYGGEEFAILLRATALSNGLVFAERVRKMTEALSITFEQKKIPVTVSIGVAVIDPDHPRTCEDLIREVDRHLYDAKERGRNRVSSPRSQ